MSFEKFAKAVYQRYSTLAKNELFVVGDDNRQLETVYLAAFPEGTNPIYLTNTEHDCNCCKNFIRNIGNLVAVVDGKIQSVWDVEAAYPYNVVAEKMAAWVRSQPITSLFRSEQSSFGAEETKQLKDGKVLKWKHFYGDVKPQHKSSTPGKDAGDYNTKVGVFRRGLQELKPEALQTVLDLIEQKALYRGQEHKPGLKAFQALQTNWAVAENKEAFVWANMRRVGSLLKNTAIGTLVADLSDGVDDEKAVKSFEAKVAPENYNRTTALVTPGMVKAAMTTIESLGLEPSLHRRMASLKDVSINDVLWADNSAKRQMKGALETLLLAAVPKTPGKMPEAADITIDKFMSEIVPTAQSMEVWFSNSHINNLMTVTAPANPDAPPLFKWANGFAWSYNGNIADSSLRKAVAERGGRVDGVFRFSHSWNHDKRNASLMDLHVFMPGGKQTESDCDDVYGNVERVGWNNRNHHRSGGVQDVDYTNPAPVGYIPVENITFPDISKMPEGRYICRIHNWSLRQPTEGGFKAEIEFGGQLFQYEWDKPLKHKQWITVAHVTLKGGVFSIEHKTPTTTTSRKVWNLDTESFVKVNTLMYSPNYWGDSATGNKHWFFIADGCKTDEPARGFYNEFLSPALLEHRKVFELCAGEMKCVPTEDQLSGLGFSSTKNDKVVVKVTSVKSTKVFNILF